MENRINNKIENNNINKDKKIIKKVIYKDKEYQVLSRNNNELLLLLKENDYFTGEKVELKQWVDIKAVKLID